MDPWRIKWDMYIIILAIYNSICLPLQIAFNPPFLETDYISGFDNVIDVCFFLDIVLTFRTTYVHPMTGEEIFDLKKIAKHYLKNQFFLDLMATIPFEKIAAIFETVSTNNRSQYTFISCLKLIRILRLGRLINYLNESDDLKMQLRLIKLCFLLALYIHVSACIWFIVCESDGGFWQPPQW